MFQIDLGILGYIILYGVTLYDISDEELLQLPKKDVLVIRRVKTMKIK